MNKKYKKYPGMKMIKRATGSSKVESTMYKAGQKMRNILDKGLKLFKNADLLPEFLIMFNIKLALNPKV